MTYTGVGEEIAEPVTYAKIQNGINFQDTTLNQNESCNALTIGTVVTMTDARNNQQYRVKKMEDNKCWMIDNLKLELTPGMTLTPSTTNVAADTTVYFTQDGTATGAALAGLTGNFTTSGYNSRDNTDSTTSPNYDAWRQNNPNTNSNCTSGSGTTYNASSITGCGYLYNFYTATAATAPQTQTSGTATGSICPANWKLPRGYNSSDANQNDFGVLNGYMAGDNAPYQSGSSDSKYTTGWQPSGSWQGVFSGYYYSSLYNQGSYGYFWSSTVNSSTSAPDLYFYSGLVYPGSSYDGRNYGFAVRCLVGV
jgi:uncharacterized protein (TIGR02145 family)